ncbi:MAG: HNH endonuclease [Blautia sp.]|nr:HNH endonuclease [Blautia sp.]
MIRNISDEYVYKKEVDWSLLMEGLTLPVDNQVVFGQIMGRFIHRGETKDITLYLEGKSYSAKIVNVNFDPRFKRKKDTYQIRYSRNGDLAKALQVYFAKSYQFIKAARDNRDPTDRKMIKLPDEYKEYLAIYTTEYDDSYILEPILVDDMQLLRETVKKHSERELEADFEIDMQDNSAGIEQRNQLIKIRKLNRKIGDNLKRLYQYRCQICGKMIGEEYGSHIAEAHHIDYFVKSLNNDASNQIIVCPNHHSIIHDADPMFDRKRLLYIYSNGFEEKVMVNRHL